jgi:hypothetical protein
MRSLWNLNDLAREMVSHPLRNMGDRIVRDDLDLPRALDWCTALARDDLTAAGILAHSMTDDERQYLLNAWHDARDHFYNVGAQTPASYSHEVLLALAEARDEVAAVGEIVDENATLVRLLGDAGK